MEVDTSAKAYWTFAQRLNSVTSPTSRKLIIDHELMPAAWAEQDEKARHYLFRLVDRVAAA